MSDHGLTYQQSGVSIDEAQRALRAVMPAIRNTHDERVIDGIGGFGGLFQADFSGLERPVLVSSIDGVGTKTKVAAMAGHFSGLGADLVNHSVNDILCQGARPLFFLDYFGCSRLEGPVFEAVVHSAAEACRAVGMPLIGGETAEMPGVYHDGEVDLVGAIVGLVDAERKLPRAKMHPGDSVIGIASSGLHTNGFTLARKALFETGGMSVRDQMPGLGTTIGEELLRVHRCYYPALWPILQEVPDVYAIAHITGGGFYDNIPRVVPTDIQVVIDRRSWTPLPIFQLIQQAGDIPWTEMFRVFNMGIGMVLFVSRSVASAVVQRLNQAGESASVIGEILQGPHDVQIV